MSAKEEILARVRTALADVPDVPIEQDAPIAWRYGRPVGVTDVLGVFIERVEDYKATVVRCSDEELTGRLAQAVRELGVSSVAAPPGLAQGWVDAIRGAGAEVTVEQPDAMLGNDELNRIDAVVTAAAVGAAETGTIVLDHTADQGRRALSLVPDVHICVVRAGQVVSGVPEAVARLRPAVLAGQPLTWISGPSATSDIELSRVEGVHGPRTLYVIVAG